MRALMLVVVLTALGCSFVADSAPSRASHGASLTPVRANVLPFLSFAPFFIAEEEGFFAEEGIRLEMVPFRSGPDALPALINGQIDVLGGGASAGTFNAVAQGLPIALVADKGHLEPGDHVSAVLIRPELPRTTEIEDPSNLKGRRISLIFPGSLMHFAVHLLLHASDLTFDDVTTVRLGWSAVRDALHSGAVDVVLTVEPLVTQLTAGGHADVLHYYGEHYQYFAPTAQIAVMMYGPRLLIQNRDLGRRFMRAYLRGVRGYRQGKTQHNLDILERHTGLSKDILRACDWYRIHPDGTLDQESLAAFQAWLHQENLVPEPVDIIDLVDTEFTNWAVRSLAADQSRESDDPN